MSGRYSIASAGQGDLSDGTTVSLCVKRLVEVDKDYGEVEEDGLYAGHKVVGNFVARDIDGSGVSRSGIKLFV